MRRLTLAFLAPLLALALAGCFQAPQAVLDAGKEQAAAVAAYGAQVKIIVSEIIEGYRKAEYEKIEIGVNQVVKDNVGKYDAEGIRKLMDLRDTKRAAIDKICEGLYSALTEANGNLLVAAKLSDAIQKYNAQGVDTSILKSAVDQILGLLNAKGK